MAESSTEQFTLTIKGGADTKLTVTVPSTATVGDLKEAIAKEKEDHPVDQQRLIFSGRVLKNEDALTKYGVKNGVAIHLVKGARPAAAANAASAARGPSEAAGVPSNFAAGQQVMGNPLAPLMNAQYAGALGGFNPFAQMGINPNDPNYLQNMMNNPEVQQQMNQLLSDPAVIDQIINSSPELQQMGPYARQLMQSEQFRQMLSNPQMMQNMTQMMGGMRGAGGMGGGGLPPMGGFGGGPQGGQQGGASAGLYNPWASTAPSVGAAGDATTGGGENGGAATTGTGAGATGAGSPSPPFNPFAMFGGAPGGGAGGQQPDFAQAMAQMQQLFGGGMGGAGAGGTPGAPQQSPEERYATELEQLRNMGFTNASRNVRALLASGGFLESAVAWLLENPE
ncbi:ubiquitin family protein [Rhodotorula paludigena]|uniref:ubiquitin family protein n=1 Tax=Rhodotorula paludigena TaxID=86838 RepID=UPI00317118FD